LTWPGYGSNEARWIGDNTLVSALSDVPSEDSAEDPAQRRLEASLERLDSPRGATVAVRRRGRARVKAALLRRLGPLQAFDARLYLAVNEGPRNGALDALCWTIAVVATGGWIWVLGTLLAYFLRVPHSWRALKRILPSLVIATWLVEYPIKAVFRRRRPFASIVDALVIGDKPSSYSFPSGHTAASFAAAWILTSVWPRVAPVFFGLAWLVGYSRVYVGAHYPGDVSVGAVSGMVLAEAVRRLVKRLAD
jgi:undecaprenyl-diphosphatase